MPLFSATVVSNREVAPDYFQLDFTVPETMGAPIPGQFFTLRVDPGPVPLLRRPFGFSAFKGEGVASTIYWRRGTATHLIAAYGPGESMDVLAPLGRGFGQPPAGTLPLLVAGGVGIGPILYLANSLAHRVPSPQILLGARTAEALPRLELDPRVTLLVATDDGSRGFHGNAVQLAEHVLAHHEHDAELFLCGPEPMLHAGHLLAKELKIRCEVAMEQMMGCAVGACMGCAVPVGTEGQYERVCTEGPVFDSSRIAWERME